MENKIKMQFFLLPQVSYNKNSALIAELFCSLSHSGKLTIQLCWNGAGMQVRVGILAALLLPHLAAAAAGQTKPPQTSPEQYNSCPDCLLLWLWPWPALSPGLCNPLHTAPSLSSPVYTAERAQARKT